MPQCPVSSIALTHASFAQLILIQVLLMMFLTVFYFIQFPDHSCIGIADKVILFIHNYATTNILEKLTCVDQLKEGSVIEVVVSGMLQETTELAFEGKQIIL